MAISKRVQNLFFCNESPQADQQELVRLPPTVVVQYNIRDADPNATSKSRRRVAARAPRRRMNLWSVEEHDRFLQGLELFPQGPWKEVAAIVGTKSTRQTMTHAQKYRQKIERRIKFEKEGCQRRRKRATAAQPMAPIDIDAFCAHLTSESPQHFDMYDQGLLVDDSYDIISELWDEVFQPSSFATDVDALMQDLTTPTVEYLPYIVSL